MCSFFDIVHESSFGSIAEGKDEKADKTEDNQEEPVRILIEDLRPGNFDMLFLNFKLKIPF